MAAGKEKEPKTQIVSVRVSESERAELERLGGGSFTQAVRQALSLLYEQHQVKPASQQ